MKGFFSWLSFLWSQCNLIQHWLPIPDLVFINPPFQFRDEGKGKKRAYSIHSATESNRMDRSIFKCNLTCLGSGFKTCIFHRNSFVEMFAVCYFWGWVWKSEGITKESRVLSLQSTCPIRFTFRHYACQTLDLRTCFLFFRTIKRCQKAGPNTKNQTFQDKCQKQKWALLWPDNKM